MKGDLKARISIFRSLELSTVEKPIREYINKEKSLEEALRESESLRRLVSLMFYNLTPSPFMGINALAKATGIYCISKLLQRLEEDGYIRIEQKGKQFSPKFAVPRWKLLKAYEEINE